MSAAETETGAALPGEPLGPRPYLDAYFLPTAIPPPWRRKGPRGRRGPSNPPRQKLLAAIDDAERHLSLIIGRWKQSARDDGTTVAPAAIRAELHELGAPLLDLLILAGRR